MLQTRWGRHPHHLLEVRGPRPGCLGQEKRACERRTEGVAHERRESGREAEGRRAVLQIFPPSRVAQRVPRSPAPLSIPGLGGKRPPRPGRVECNFRSPDWSGVTARCRHNQSRAREPCQRRRGGLRAQPGGLPGPLAWHPGLVSRSTAPTLGPSARLPSPLSVPLSPCPPPGGCVLEGVWNPGDGAAFSGMGRKPEAALSGSAAPRGFHPCPRNSGLPRHVRR